MEPPPELSNLINSFINENKSWISWFFSGIGTDLLFKSFPALIVSIPLFFKFTRTIFIENLKGITLGVILALIILPHSIDFTHLFKKKEIINYEEVRLEEIEAAFNKVFGSNWFLEPYTDDKDTENKKNCVEYQGIWNLDTRSSPEVVPYFFKFKFREQYIYYVAHSVTAYAWCKSNVINSLDNEKEDKLEMVEFLINEIYLTKDNNPVNTKNFVEFKNKTYLIGKIGGLFTDTIDFINDQSGSPCPKQGEPCNRKGTRIGRYNLKIENSTNENLSFNKKKEALELVKKYIRNLKPNCSVSMDDQFHEKNGAGDSNFKLEVGNSIMDFECFIIYDDLYETNPDKKRKNEKYNKRLIIKKEWHNL